MGNKNVEEEFKRFLTYNGCLTEFLTYVVDWWQDTEPNTYLNSNLVWSKTQSGVGFWKKMDLKWEEHLKYFLSTNYNPNKIVLLNGGIGCGKTDLTTHLKQKFPEMKDRRCKDHLHDLTQKLFCVDPDLYWEIYNTRELKEKPNDAFMLSGEELWRLDERLGRKPSVKFPKYMYAISIREAMIYVSECVCKPAFGLEYFGEARVKAMKEDSLSIDDSTGFLEELYPLIKSVGQENIMLIRIQGRGSFEGDSRDFIPDGVINNTVDLWNVNSLESFLEKGEQLVSKFLTTGEIND